LGGWQLDHLAPVVNAGALQAIVALWAARECVRFAAGGRFTSPPAIVVRRALLARALGFGGRGAIGFDERRWVVVLLLQFSNALLRCGKLLRRLRKLGLRLRELGAQCLVFRPQLGQFVVVPHVPHEYQKTVMKASLNTYGRD